MCKDKEKLVIFSFLFSLNIIHLKCHHILSCTSSTQWYPTLFLEGLQQYTHMSDTPITGLCCGADVNQVWWVTIDIIV